MSEMDRDGRVLPRRIWGREETHRLPEKLPEEDERDDLDTWWATICGSSSKQRKGQNHDR